MCVGPVGAILSAGLSIAGAMVEYQAANEAADAQNQYYMANAKASQQAAVNSYMYQNTRLNQEKMAADQEAFENSVKALEKRGTAYTSAGEAGVSGLSVDALVGNIFAQEGRQRMAVDTQFQMNRENILSEMEQTRAQSQSRINSVQRANYPSVASYLIKGASGAVNAFRPNPYSALQIA